METSTGETRTAVGKVLWGRDSLVTSKRNARDCSSLMMFGSHLTPVDNIDGVNNGTNNDLRPNKLRESNIKRQTRLSKAEGNRGS